MAKDRRDERLAELQALGVQADVGKFVGQIVLNAGQTEKLLRLLRRLKRLEAKEAKQEKG